MSAIPDHHLGDHVIPALDKAIADTPVPHRVRRDRVVGVARYLLEWSWRHDGGRYCDVTVNQIATATCLSPGTVRSALAILERAELAIVIGHGGGTARRGSRRRLELSAGNGTARAQTRVVDELSARAQTRAEAVATARVTHPTARVTPLTARAQTRDSDLSDLFTDRARELGSRWVDDSDVEASPPPLAETIAAIRARTGNYGSPLMDGYLNGDDHDQ